MPLSYDNKPGSWGVYSQNWPKLTFQSDAQVRRAFVACSKEKIVPYGSYVQDGLELRVETEDQKERLERHLRTCRLKTAEEVIEIFGR